MELQVILLVCYRELMTKSPIYSDCMYYCFRCISVFIFIDPSSSCLGFFHWKIHTSSCASTNVSAVMKD